MNFHSLSLMKILVGPSGLEPPTSCLSGTRSNLLSYEPMWLASKWFSSLGFFTCSLLPFSEKWRVKSEEVRFSKKISGGDEGIRTLDPLLAGQVLSQLSYTPKSLLLDLGFEWAFTLLRYPGRRLSPRCQHWAIFPCGRPQSIFTTAELNFRVRNGNGWTLCVYNTDFFLHSKNSFLVLWKLNNKFISSLSRPSFTLLLVWWVTRSP